jgi:peptide/nickel transport system permease protein
VFLLGFMFLSFVIAPLVSPFDPAQVEMGKRLQPINAEHLLGTDHLGRDILSRILSGAQTTVGTSLLVLGITILIGLPIGLFAGYIGGVIDRLIMRVSDTFLAFPDYIVAIVLSGLLGPGMLNLMFAIVTVKWVGYTRLVRSTVLSEKQKDYVSVAKINGMRPFRILLKHMLPHVIGNVMVLATLDMGKIILLIASLSYIGLGAQPPTPEWGAMLNEGKAYFYHAPQLMIIPGLSIMLVVLIFNWLGDYLRDKYDVKKQKGGM